jgi:hypothetical protein
MGEMMMQIPAEWLTEAGLQNFTPVRSSFRCDVPHELIALTDIEKFVRSIPIDANGFRRSKMMPVLAGIRDGNSFLPIYIETADPGQRPYRLRDGVHRYYAALTLGFSHVPSEIVERIDL